MNFIFKCFLTAVSFSVLTSALRAGDFTPASAPQMLENARAAACRFWCQSEVIDPVSGYHIWFSIKGKEPEPKRWGNPMAESLRVFYTHSVAYAHASDPHEKARIRKMLDYGMDYFEQRRKAGNGFFPNKERFDTARRCIRQVNAVYMIADAAAFTGDKKIAEFARSLFDGIYAEYHDPEHGGFFERLPGEHPQVRYKRLETQLLATAAINSLYKLYPTADYRNKLEEMFRVITAPRIFHSSGLPREWFYRDFNPMNGSKPMYDEAQYGHAAEAGWIICEAAASLGVPDKEVKKILATMAETLLRDGADKSGAARTLGTYSRGPSDQYFDPYWWNSLELMNFSIMYYKVSRDKRFLDFYFKLGNYAFKNFPLPDGVWTQVSHSAKEPLYRGGHTYKSGWHTTHAAILQKNALQSL